MSDGGTKSVLACFALLEERWDSRDYPYWETLSLWDDHLSAHDCLESYKTNNKRKIVLRHLVLHFENNRLMWKHVMTVFENGEWVSPDHDPRAADPQYREYLRLKAIYEEK